MSGAHSAQDLSDAALGGPLRIQDGQFVDAFGRTVCLRGLNISGASKLPTKPHTLSHLTAGFYESHRTVTFVGRPFPLEDAPLHFRRLQAWGLPFVRLLVTWESIGHAGPNPNTDLDLEYIAYLRKLIELMPKYGIKCFICAHQDVWSRFSGGSGAPGWTFEAAGLDIEAFTATGAAYVHGPEEDKRKIGPNDPRETGGPFMWPSNHQKLAIATIATLFWAGDAMAPQLKCLRTPLSGEGEAEEVSIQTFLQDAYFEAFGRLADEVSSLEACIGFEPINEPHRGLVNLHGFDGWDFNTDLHIGHFPSFAQSLALGSGYPQTVKYYVKSWPVPTRISHSALFDPKGRSAWLGPDGKAVADRPRGMGQCVWRAHGVWDWDAQKKCPTIFQRNYFDVDHRPGQEGKPVEWYRDFYAPFLGRFAERMARNRVDAMAFVEPVPNEFMPHWPAGEDSTNGRAALQQKYSVKTVIETKRPKNFVYAAHFYDLNVVFSKTHSLMSVNVQGLARGMFPLNALYFGEVGLRKNYSKQISNIAKFGYQSLGKVPIVIGEVGIPFDINGSAAFKTGNYDLQRQLMDTLISAMEECRVGFTLWNYNPDNSAEHGDGWNKEDFSVVNGDEYVENGHIQPDYRNQRHEDDELYRGGRVIDAVIRPYAAKIAGEPTRSMWDSRTLRFEFEWSSSPDRPTKSRITEVYLPNYHYAEHQLDITVSNCEWRHDAEKQTIYLTHEPKSSVVSHHGLVVAIKDVQSHLIRRVQQRRSAYPPQFPLSLVPDAVEVWLEGVSIGRAMVVLLAIFAIILSVLAARP